MIKISKKLKLTLPLPVSVNHYLGHRISGGRGKKFIHTYKTQEAISFERIAKPIILKEVQAQKWVKPSENTYIRVEATWFFHKKGLDSSNMHKQVLDILQRCEVYYNDNMVLECSKDYYIDAKNPRCEIVLSLMDKEGVFATKDDKKRFCTSNCHLCSKKKNNCTFFKKLLENRIIEEIDLDKNICHKIKLKKKIITANDSI